MTTVAQTVPAGTYALDPVHSTFGFAVKHNGVSTFRGIFEQADAKLENGVLLGTAQVDSIKTAIPDLKGHLLAPDFFNAEQTPTVTFQSADIRIGDEGAVEVDGDLTIRGITKPVTATGTFGAGTGIAGKEVVGFDLDAKIDRREYGIEWQAPLPNGGEALGWDVSLEIHLELSQA